MTIAPRLALSLLLTACMACGAGSAQSGGPEGGLFGEPGSGSSGSSGSEGAGDGGAGGDAAHPAPEGGAGEGGATKDDDAVIALTFSGCSPVFSDVRVTTNVVAFDSLGVSSAFAPLSGGVQIALKDATPRTVTLSTTQRSQTSNSVVINVFAGGTTYTNLCSAGPTGCSFDAASSTWKNDPIGGTFQVKLYDPKQGKLDVAFTNVTLQAVSGAALCKVSGTLQTRRLSL